MTGSHIAGLLRERYTHPEWRLFIEAASSPRREPGTRIVDAYALNLSPEKKHIRIAFEIKVSRSDFLSELNDPAKRDFAYSVANEFYFVVPADVIREGELPEGAGLMLATENAVVVKQKAAYRDVPQTLPASFVAALVAGDTDISARKLFRYAGNEISRAELDTMIDAEVAAKVNARFEDEVKRGVREVAIRSDIGDERVQYALTELERALGRPFREGDSLAPLIDSLRALDEMKSLSGNVADIKTAFDLFYRKLNALLGEDDLIRRDFTDDDYYD